MNHVVIEGQVLADEYTSSRCKIQVQIWGRHGNSEWPAVSHISWHGQPRPAKRDGFGGTSMTEASNSDIRAQLKKIASGQNTIMNKIRENHDDLKTMIATEVSKVRADVFLEMSQITRRLDVLESRSPVATNIREPFSPDVTVVIANLALVSAIETKAALMDKINYVLAEGLALPGIKPMVVTRRAASGRGPGLVLLELNDVGDKITVLKAKQSLRNKPENKNLYLSSTEGHTDCLMRLNLRD